MWFDCIVVGEVRGVEVVDLLVVFNIGYEGGVGIVYVNNLGEVFVCMEVLGVFGGFDCVVLYS